VLRLAIVSVEHTAIGESAKIQEVFCVELMHIGDRSSRLDFRVVISRSTRVSNRYTIWRGES